MRGAGFQSGRRLDGSAHKRVAGLMGSEAKPAQAPRPAPPGPGADPGQLVDVVATYDEAVRLRQPPLIVLEGLDRVIPGEGEVEFERLSAGHSNVTGIVRRRGREWILRRPPRPPYAPRAHDVIRECRILEALKGTAVPVPKVAVRCEDEAVIGVPFYVMDRVDGHVLRSEIPAELGAGCEPGVTESLVGGLLSVHEVEWEGLDLPFRGGSTYLERQLSLWRGQWEQNRTRELPDLESLGRDLASSMPVTQRTTIVHGDYKLDNVVFAPAAPPRLTSILDWEMSTVGDPLADLGFLVSMWIGGGGDPESLLGLSRVTAQPGFPARDELVALYAAGSDLDLSDLIWYEALALWKLAILLEGSYRRFLGGTDDDPFFAALGAGVPTLGEMARERFEQGRRRR